MKDAKKWEFGDFQTPTALASEALDHLKRAYPSFNPQTIIEPTCGVGGFLIAAADAFPNAKTVIGVEIEGSYLSTLNEKIAARSDQARFDIRQQDFFAADWAEHILAAKQPVLIIGNPPWVTSSDIGRLHGSNLPEKSNFQKYKGFEAVTGKSNFDISEWMLLRHLEWLADSSGSIAMLCKTAVARKILRSVWKGGQSDFESRIIKINALKHFGAAVDACFFILQKTKAKVTESCPVFDDFHSEKPCSVLGFHSGMMLSDVPTFSRQRTLLGNDKNYVWRSGIKHDCSKVMELKKDGNELHNGLGESVEIEADYLFPLLKSSDLGNARLLKTRYLAVVTQRKVGQSTEAIRDRAPRTWSYLMRHGERLDKRGSVIYRKKPRFSIFGVGDYTFTPWKLAISGFYKSLEFQVVSPINDSPVVFDDTVYFLNAHSKAEAEFLSDMLNSKPARMFLESMIFWADKRPITVDLLKRLHIGKLAEKMGREKEYMKFTEERTDQANRSKPYQLEAMV